jgi:lysophospholipase L1-like esterase
MAGTISRGRLWLFRVTAVLLSSALSLAGLEACWRLLKFKRLGIQAGIEHPHFHHRLKPNQTYHFESAEFSVDIRTNRYGLRWPDPVLPKPAGVFRILILGDSFTFGFPVRDDEAFCFLIEQGLRAKGYPVEVINAGVSGYSPTLQYVSLRDEYLAFEPDLVLLWYDLGDLQEDAWYQKNLVYDASGRILRCDPAYTNGRFDVWEWVRTHSLIANYLDRKLIRLYRYIKVLGLGGFIRAKLRGQRAKVAVAQLKAEQQAPDLAAHDRFLLVREYSTEERLAPYWALSSRYLRMIRELLAGRGIPLVLGVYPYGMLVGPQQWAAGRGYWGFEPGRTYEAAAALAIFNRFSSETGIPLLNTFESFRAADRTGKLFYDQDGHFTPAGHRVLAEHVVHDARLLSLLGERIRKVPSAASLPER